ncbi:MAG: cytochrome c [Terracidiphilus sp.]|jgi:mono/diheme cytochrome c family protein
MKKMILSLLVSAVVMYLASTVCLAESEGQAVYKAHCQSCHGSAGVPNPNMARMMGIKAVTDPAIKTLTVPQMITAVKNGKGKMKPIAGLTEAQIKDAVIFYRSFLNPQPLPPGQ